MKKITFFSGGFILVLFFTIQSVSARGTLIPTPDPNLDIPQVEQVTVAKKTNQAITLHWTAVPLATGYDIQVTQGDTLVTTIKTKKTTKTVTDLTADTTYTFEVRAKLGEDYGEYSEPITAKTRSIVAIPFDPDYMLANQLIVKMEKGHKLKTDYPKRKLLISKYTKHKYVFVKINDHADSDKVITHLNKMPGVISIEYDAFFTPTTVTANDTYYNNEWHHTSSGMYSNEAWNEQKGSANIVVAILDSGVQMDHADLKDNLWSNSAEIANNGIDDDKNGFIDDINGWDFYYDDNDLSPNPNGLDDNADGRVDEYVTHGTTVSGSIAAVSNNGIGVTGEMWDASIMMLQVANADGYPSYGAIIDAVYYAIENKADIINMSFSGSSNISSFKEALDIATDKGIFVVASAGNNSSEDLNTTPKYPVCYENVFGVGGYKNDGTGIGSHGSNCVDLMGPYNDIYTTNYVNPTYGFTSEYSTVNGTSFSSPLVGGVVGLMLIKNPTLTVTQLSNILVATVTPKPNISTNYGAGLVNAAAALAGVDCLNSDDSVKTVTAYYADADGDGYGTSDMIYACVQPNNSATNSNDCNDADKNTYGKITYYKDADGDSLGDPNNATLACSTPSGYVTNANDKNDSDYDNDGTSSSSDCNDKDSGISSGTITYYKDADGDGVGVSSSITQVCSSTSPSGYALKFGDCNDADKNISSNQTYYKDADGDGLGTAGSTTSMCSNTAPSGYVTNSSDKNDSDYDNDGVSTSSDCNDKDSTLSSNKTYYQDADGDGLGNLSVTTSACSTSAPSGYVNNSTDTNDQDFDNDGAETDADCNDQDNTIEQEQLYYADADGDDLGDPATSTSVCSVTAPTGYVDNFNDNDDTQYSIYADNDPADKDTYEASVKEINGIKNGKIKVTFQDNSELKYQIFEVETDTKTKVVSYNTTGYLVVLHPYGKVLALVNVYNGEVYEQEELGDKKFKTNNLKLFDLRADATTEAIVTSKKETTVRTTIIKIKPTKDNKLKLTDSLSLDNDVITPKTTNPQEKKIELRNEDKVVQVILTVNSDYVLTIKQN